MDRGSDPVDISPGLQPWNKVPLPPAAHPSQAYYSRVRWLYTCSLPPHGRPALSYSSPTWSHRYHSTHCLTTKHAISVRRKVLQYSFNCRRLWVRGRAPPQSKASGLQSSQTHSAALEWWFLTCSIDRAVRGSQSDFLPQALFSWSTLQASHPLNYPRFHCHCSIIQPDDPCASWVVLYYHVHGSCQFGREWARW